MVQEVASCKNNYSLAFFSKILKYISPESYERQAFEYVRVLIITGIEKVLNIYERALE